MSSTIHIGFHKTGTTALQQHFFGQLPGAVYMGPRTSPAVDAMLSDIAHAEDGTYLAYTWRTLVAEKATRPHLVVSHESFSRYNPGGRTARRLHDLWPDASVLVVVRNQLSMLRSLYHQYLKHAGTLAFDRWANTFLDLDWVRFDRAVASYQEVFGLDKVTVMLHEEFAARPEAFLAELRRMMVPDEPGPAIHRPLPLVNTSLAWPSLEVHRQLNRWFRTGPYNDRALLYPLDARRFRRALRRFDPIVLGPRWRAERPRDTAAVAGVAAGVAASNERLAAITGLHLDRHEYPLP